MPRRLLVWLLAAASVGSAAAADLKLSGYYKNLLAGSKTVAPAGERYTLDLNRLRLELKGPISDAVALDLQYDNEVLLGDYLRTAQFGASKDARPDQRWNLDSNYGEGGAWYGRHRLYRGNVTISSGETDLRLGRQRVAWGTGRFWSPVDILNPINPIALEREERPGVDAVLLERKLGPLSRVSGVYAPRQESAESSAAVNWHSNVSAVDYSIIAGRFRGERVFGADLATQVGTAGLRAELTHNGRDTGPSYRRAVVAMDYALANTLTVSGELYYNGAGATDRTAYDFTSLFAGRIQNVGRRYLGAFVSYEITPLLKSINYMVVNLADRSRFAAPSLVYSLQENVDLTLGVQLFGGRAGTEYARLNDLVYAQLQWFF